MDEWILSGFSLLRLAVSIILTAAAVSDDIRRYKISNKIIIGGGLAAGIILAGEAISKKGNGVLEYALGCLAAFGLMFAAYWLHAVGAGDVKLTAVLGGLLGMQKTAALIAGAFVCAGIMGIAGVLCGKCADTTIVFRHTAFENKENNIRFHKLHFSIAILLGEVIMAGYSIVKGGIAV